VVSTLARIADTEVAVEFVVIGAENGDKPPARRKPGEPDARLGTPAPATAGHNRPRPKEQIA